VVQRRTNRPRDLSILCEAKANANGLAVVTYVVEHNAWAVIGVVGKQFDQTERVRDRLLQSWRPVASQIFVALIDVWTIACALKRCSRIVEVQQAVETARSTQIKPIHDNGNGIEGGIEHHDFPFQRGPSATPNE